MTQLDILKKHIEDHPEYRHSPGPEDTDENAIIIEGQLSGGPITVKVWKSRPWQNDRGNTVHPGSDHAERYKFDKMCSPDNGWTQYDTTQDAWYFGVWVHDEERLTFTYAEGDISLVECPTEESFQAELKNMAEFYGPPPPALKVLGDGFKAEVYAEENAYGREIPEDGIAVPTMSDAAKLVLGGGEREQSAVE